MVGTISLDLIIHECFRLMSEIHGEIILFSLILDGYNDFLLPNPVMAIVCTYTITTKQHDGESFIMYVIIRSIVLEVTRGYFKLRTNRKNVNPCCVHRKRAAAHYRVSDFSEKSDTR